ncbi:hypothetical protein DFJ58DRAFT_910624 [Suillus subalutaceus]|uniref:uncharacterized protein n=1 Tax=Suillus subalutaceus TaxID=48586 RepID=UPI001B88311E|nr:uncharacterized protein DFJ58DRAFT_910624 [Suillus subalutaceus]KAG1872299.1 hypothetical protein DFJ58DRAFT_910624 [Suillus subalutaceus]
MCALDPSPILHMSCPSLPRSIERQDLSAPRGNRNKIIRLPLLSRAPSRRRSPTVLLIARCSAWWFYENMVIWTDDYKWTDDEALRGSPYTGSPVLGPALPIAFTLRCLAISNDLGRTSYPTIPMGASYFPQELLLLPSAFAATKLTQDHVREGGPAFAIVPGKKWICLNSQHSKANLLRCTSMRIHVRFDREPLDDNTTNDTNVIVRVVTAGECV